MGSEGGRNYLSMGSTEDVTFERSLETSVNSVDSEEHHARLGGSL